MKTSRGLSLIEVTIVLVIIGLLLGGLLIPLSAQMDQQKIELTKKRLEEIKEALLGFAIIHNRLPCVDVDKDDVDKDKPDVSPEDGQEDKEPDDPTKCYVSENNKKKKYGEGYLPWKDLGVGKYDAWNNPFRYRIKVDKDKKTTITLTLITSTSKLKVRRSNGGSYLTTSSDSRIIAIIFSCGKNGIPDDDNATGIQSDRKCSNPGYSNLTYVQDGYIENSFDDILTWLSKNTLMNRLVAAGQWPPAP